MNFALTAVIEFLTGNGVVATLLITLSTALALGWHAWRRDGSHAAEYLCLAAIGLLVYSTIPLPYMAYAALTGTDPAIWSGPLDRFAATLLLVTLALTLATSSETPRRRAGLLGVLGLAAIGWSAWAGVWADLYRADPARFATHDPTALSPIWDLALAGAAVMLGISLLRRPLRPPAWLVTSIGLFALGALLDAIVPLRPTAAVWTHAGTLGAALTLTATALVAPWGVRGQESTASTASRRLRRIVRSAGADVEARTPDLPIGDTLVALDPTPGAGVPAHLTRAEANVLTELRERVGILDRRLVEQTRATNEARAAATLFGSSLKRLPIGLVVVDAAGRVLAANPSAERRLRVTLDTGASLPARLSQPAADPLARALHDVKTSGRTKFEIDVSGLRRTLEIQSLVDDRGVHAGAIVLIDPGDVVAERAGEIIPPLVDAIRGPVRGLMAFSSLITGTHRLPEAELQSQFGLFTSHLRYLEVMLSDLCTALEIEEGAPPHRPGAIADVADVLRACVERSQPQFGEKAVDLALAVEGWLPPALVDTQVLAQIVDNLLTNAANHSPYGSRATLRATLDRSDEHRWNVRVRLDYRDRGTAEVTGGGASSTPVRPALLIARVLTERANCVWREEVVDDDGGARIEVNIPAKVA